MTTPRCPTCCGHKKLFTRTIEDCTRCEAGTYSPPCRRCAGDKFITVQNGYKATCGTCKGTGRNLRIKLTCFRCHGHGQQVRTRVKRCTDCHGTGQLILNPVLLADFSLPLAA